jgi:hypothetical protein
MLFENLLRGKRLTTSVTGPSVVVVLISRFQRPNGAVNFIHMFTTINIILIATVIDNSLLVCNHGLGGRRLYDGAAVVIRMLQVHYEFHLGLVVHSSCSPPFRWPATAAADHLQVDAVDLEEPEELPDGGRLARLAQTAHLAPIEQLDKEAHLSQAKVRQMQGGVGTDQRRVRLCQ